MPHIHPVRAAGSLNWPVMYGECDSITLLERNDLGPALHPWALFGKHKFTAGKIASRLR
jgi:hypothetical protein